MKTQQRKIEVCISPALFSLHDTTSCIVVVIDILRATSAICVAFENGAKEMIPVAKVEECFEYKKKGFLVAGERNGETLPEFDFGNSPFTYMNSDMQGKSIAITTTNGTQAIDVARNAQKVVIGSFLNISVLTDWLLQQNQDVLFLCAGWKNKFNMEDTLFAGALADRLLNSNQYVTDCDSTIAAQHLFNLANGDLYGFLANSSHRKRLTRLNIEKDIEFCLMMDLTRVVPILEGDSLKCIRISESMDKN